MGGEVHANELWRTSCYKNCFASCRKATAFFVLTAAPYVLALQRPRFHPDTRGWSLQATILHYIAYGSDLPLGLLLDEICDVSEGLADFDTQLLPSV